MPRNGSGTYSRVTGTPYVNGTTIDEVVVNNEMNDIGTAITQSLAKDGQTSPTANLPMATYRHTGVGAGAALTDYARYDQVQNSSPMWLTSVSGADTITASASVTPAAYAAGQTFRFVAAGANTGAVTLNVSSLGAKSVTKNGTTALAAGDIPANSIVTVSYDGTQFQLVGYVTGAVSLTGYAQLSADQEWTGSQRGAITTDNDLSFDLNAANNFTCTPTAGGTLTFTNITAGQSGFIKLVNGSNYAIAAHANTKVTTTFLTTVSATGTYIISYYSDGTNVFCATAGAMA